MSALAGQVYTQQTAVRTSELETEATEQLWMFQPKVSLRWSIKPAVYKWNQSSFSIITISVLLNWIKRKHWRQRETSPIKNRTPKRWSRMNPEPEVSDAYRCNSVPHVHAQTWCHYISTGQMVSVDLTENSTLTDSQGWSSSTNWERTYKSCAILQPASAITPVYC